MHGSVWDWCQDSCQEDLGSTAQTDPLVQLGVRRVLRGGSWFDYGVCCRSAFRGGLRADRSKDFIGFRFSLVIARSAALQT